MRVMGGLPRVWVHRLREVSPTHGERSRVREAAPEAALPASLSPLERPPRGTRDGRRRRDSAGDLDGVPPWISPRPASTGSRTEPARQRASRGGASSPRRRGARLLYRPAWLIDE